LDHQFFFKKNLDSVIFSKTQTPVLFLGELEHQFLSPKKTWTLPSLPKRTRNTSFFSKELELCHSFKINLNTVFFEPYFFFQKKLKHQFSYNQNLYSAPFLRKNSNTGFSLKKTWTLFFFKKNSKHQFFFKKYSKHQSCSKNEPWLYFSFPKKSNTSSFSNNSNTSYFSINNSDSAIFFQKKLKTPVLSKKNLNSAIFSKKELAH